MPIVRLEEPSLAPPPRGFALFNLGFRPFYLLAALAGAAVVAFWLAVVAGGAWGGYLAPLLWHQHEMVFGFALAVIAGFLLTAGRVWTGLATPSGVPLALLAMFWLAARLVLYTGPAPLAALVDGAFPFALAAVMARVILRARDARNYFVIVLLGALGAANVAFHLGYGAIAVKVALYLVLALVLVMAGRVVPSFTANALPAAGVVKKPRLDYTSIAVSVAAFAADLGEWDARAVAVLAFAAGALHGVRQWGWKPLATRSKPILWILHLSHVWFPIGFLLLALSALGLIAPSASIHAFGAGAMGGLIIGMITRTALGHTGRPLAAGRSETLAYVLVHVAASLRVLAALVPAFGYLPLIELSGAAWVAAFLIYLVSYAPRLAAPRIDGKPG